MHNLKNLYLVEIRVMVGHYSQFVNYVVCLKKGLYWFDVVSGRKIDHVNNNMFIGFSEKLNSFCRIDKDKLSTSDIRGIIIDLEKDKVSL